MHPVLLLALPLALAAPTSDIKSAPLDMPTTRAVAGKYIVKFKDGKSVNALDDTLSVFSRQADHVFSNVFNGFAGSLDDTALETLRGHPDVDYIEQDSIASVTGYVSQSNAHYGLKRISHRKAGGSAYTYDDSAGSGTCAYILDTGVYAKHRDFEGRATQLTSFIDGEEDDGFGHGTHVAGTVGSKTYGVAKKTTIYGVKVLDNTGNGPWSGVIAGLEYVAKDSKTRDCPKGVVVNMSLEGDHSDGVNSASASLMKSGIFVGVAAGNAGRDVGNSSPASEPSICTVGGSDSRDGKAGFTNVGKVIDIFAPGDNIPSTYNNGGTANMSGTSMSSPHVVGLAAYLMALEGNAKGEALCKRIQELATKGALSGMPSGTANLLAFNGNPSG